MVKAHMITTHVHVILAWFQDKLSNLLILPCIGCMFYFPIGQTVLPAFAFDLTTLLGVKSEEIAYAPLCTMLEIKIAIQILHMA